MKSEWDDSEPCPMCGCEVVKVTYYDLLTPQYDGGDWMESAVRERCPAPGCNCRREYTGPEYAHQEGRQND